MSDDLDLTDRIRRVEDAIWGFNRTNGMVGEIRALRRDFQEWRNAQDQREREAAKERSRNRLTVIGIVFAGVSSTIGAILAISQAAGG